MADQNVIDDLRAESDRIDRVVAMSALAAFAASAGSREKTRAQAPELLDIERPL